MPLQPAGLVAQAQVPGLNAPPAFVDLSGFASGIANFTKTTLARQAANAGNLGRAAAYSLEKQTAMETQAYINANAHKASFPQDFVEFQDKIRAPIIAQQNLDGAALAAFQTIDDHRMAGVLANAQAFGHKAFVADQTALGHSNVQHALRGVEKMSPGAQEEAWATVADIYTDLGNPGTGAPGVMTPGAAYLEQEAVFAQTALNILHEQLKHDNEQMYKVLVEGEGTLRVPVVVPGTTKIVRYEDGTMAFREIPLTPAQRADLQKIKESELDASNLLTAEVHANVINRQQLEKANFDNDLAVKAWGGDYTSAYTAMMSATYTDGTPMFNSKDLAAANSFLWALRNQSATTITTDDAAFWKLSEKASQGTLTNADIQDHLDTISREDLQRFAAKNLDVKNSQFDRGNTEYKSQKKTAEGLLRQYFSLHPAFSSDPAASGLAHLALSEFEERSRVAYKEAIAKGLPLSSINSQQLSQDIIAEKSRGLYNILAPTGRHLEKNLAKWYWQEAMAAKKENREPSLRGIYLALEHDPRMADAPVSRQQHAFLLKAVVEQGLTFSTLGAIIGDKGDLAPYVPPDTEDGPLTKMYDQFFLWIMDKISGPQDLNEKE